MTVMSVSDVYSQASQPSQPDNSVMGKDDFLTLLVAQLQHQDPLNPAEGTEFTAQLAQFSSLEQLSNMNGQLEEMAHSQAAFASSQAVGYIGHTVLSEGSDFAHDGEADAALAFELEAPAHNVYLSIYDATGGFVSSFECGSKAAGRQTAPWDGKDSDGNPMPPGDYRFEAMAVSAGGEELGVRALSSGRVDGVAFADGQAVLKIGRREVAMKDVIEVIRPAGTPSES